MFPYTAEIYASMIAQYNAALWPAAAVALALGVSVLVLAIHPQPGGGRAIGGLLAVAWAVTGYFFLYERFATLNFAAPVYALLFGIEAVLIAIFLVLRAPPAIRFRRGVAGGGGLALLLFALAGYPVQALGLPNGLAAAQVAGLAPGPTAVLTLGVLLLIDGRAPWVLAVLPILWCLWAGAVAWLLGVPDDAILPVLGLAAFGLILAKNRRVRNGVSGADPG